MDKILLVCVIFCTIFIWEIIKYIYRVLSGKKSRLKSQNPLDIVAIEIIDVHIDSRTKQYTIMYKIKTNQHGKKKEIIKFGSGIIGSDNVIT